MNRVGFRSAGRRLNDGAAVAGQSASRGTVYFAGLSAVVIAVAMCPSHSSFESYLVAAAAHPSGLLGSLASVAQRLKIAVLAESRSYLLFRVGTLHGRSFIGAFGIWAWVPAPPQVSFGMPRDVSSLMPSFCAAGSSAPHELFAQLCIVGFLLFQFSPRVSMRHAYCSLNALRDGRLWTALTANVAHAHPLHLLHNMLQLLHLGPVVHSVLGCEKSLMLLVLASLASSAASVVWHGVLHRRGGAGSVGASGVVSALLAANAVFFPNTIVHLYGFELSALPALAVYLLLDALPTGGRQAGGEIDVSAHAGGVLAGWVLAKRWKPWYLW